MRVDSYVQTRSTRRDNDLCKTAGSFLAILSLQNMSLFALSIYLNVKNSSSADP